MPTTSKTETSQASDLRDESQKKPRKLSMKWHGPYTVFKKINDVLYRVGKHGNHKGDIIYHNRLKASFHGTNKPSNSCNPYPNRTDKHLKK